MKAAAKSFRPLTALSALIASFGLSATPADAQLTHNPATSRQAADRPTAAAAPGRLTRPDSAPRRPVANRKASLVLFYYGDGTMTTAGQDTLRLKKAMEGYDRKVLLKHNFTPSWIDFSEADERIADLILTPTQDNFFAQLKALAEDDFLIDIYIFAHGEVNSSGDGYFTVSNGSHGNTGTITESEIRAELAPSRTGFTKMPIRMVWGTNCYGSEMNDTWTSVGAKAVMGSREVNFYPTSFKKFIDLWNQGNKSFSTAVGDSITPGTRTSAQLYIANIHAPSTPGLTHLIRRL